MNHGPMPPSAGALTSYGEIERYIARARELRAEATAAMLWETPPCRGRAWAAGGSGWREMTVAKGRRGTAAGTRLRDPCARST